ncbi:TPA: hypothetical protein ACHTJU_003294 [Escherichia coli]
MQIIAGQELDIIDAKTQKYIATVKALGVRDWDTEYPFNALYWKSLKLMVYTFTTVTTSALTKRVIGVAVTILKQMILICV